MAIANFNNSVFKIITVAFTTFLPGASKAQSPFAGLENLFNTPESYVAKYISKAPLIDGNLNDAAWQQVNWSNDFVDIEGDLKPKPPNQTNIKMLWDDHYLYVAARMTEPQVWATLKKHDDIIYHDNDFELFIDPSGTSHNYYEIEVNALNTIFDLYLNKPYRNGGGALIGWDATGLRSAVKIHGTLNNTSDTDKGWTVEMAIPFKSINMGFTSGTPKDGAIYRINFSRVEYDTKIQNNRNVKLKDAKGYDLPEHNWSWSPQGEINMHSPEHWGYLLFSKSNDADIAFTLPYAEQQKKYLWLIYYRQKQWYKAHQQYTESLADLGIENTYPIAGKDNKLTLEASKSQFKAYINAGSNGTSLSINHEGFTEQTKNTH